MEERRVPVELGKAGVGVDGSHVAMAVGLDLGPEERVTTRERSNESRCTHSLLGGQIKLLFCFC